MTKPISDASLDQIFRNARTKNTWQDQSVSDTLIRAVYDLTKLGPTSANCSPARFVFVQSAEAKEKLKPCLMEGNVEPTMAAPVTVIIAHDLDFPERIPELFPHNPDAKHWFDDPQNRAETAFRNGSLQGAYLIMAARSLGLDCGPMSGFDKSAVEKAFFRGHDGRENWSANFLCNIGYGGENEFARSPRLDFDDACSIE